MSGTPPQICPVHGTLFDPARGPCPSCEGLRVGDLNGSLVPRWIWAMLGFAVAGAVAAVAAIALRDPGPPQPAPDPSHGALAMQASIGGNAEDQLRRTANRLDDTVRQAEIKALTLPDLDGVGRDSPEGLLIVRRWQEWSDEWRTSLEDALDELPEDEDLRADERVAADALRTAHDELQRIRFGTSGAVVPRKSERAAHVEAAKASIQAARDALD